MLLRMLNARCCFTARTMMKSLTGRAAAAYQATSKGNIHSTARALDGGGHHSEPTPVHIPQPERGKRTIFGEARPERMTSDDAYNPMEDISSYVGAAIAVIITGLAVSYYSLGEGSKRGQHASKRSTAASPEEHGHKAVEAKPAVVAEEKEKKAEEVAEEEVRPVVERKLVVVPVEVPASGSEEAAKGEETEEVEPQGSATKEPVEAASALEEDKAAATTEKTLAAGELPSHVPYLVVGGGAAGYYASLVIRAREPEARVLLISDEMELPYNRPPLSKELWWYGNDRSREHLEYKAPSGRTRDIYFEAEGFFVAPHDLLATAHGAVSIARGRRVVKVDASTKRALLDDGKEITFDKCLIATGGSPRKLAELEKASEEVNERVVYYRGVNDFRRLDTVAAKAKSITVIGGGLLGSELAYSMKRRYPAVEINQIVEGRGQLADILPEYLSLHANEESCKFGVKVLPYSRVSEATVDGEGVKLRIANKKSTEERELVTDLVVVDNGIEPNVDIGRKSGFETDPVNGGILADAELRVRGDVYSAGDACSFWDASLGRRRVESWENAMVAGRLAGENMTGGHRPFWYQPSFFTKIAPNLIINAVGDTREKHETVSVYAKTDAGENYDRGVVFYTKENKVVGVALVNILGAGIDVARRIIEDAKPIAHFKELAKLFPLYENTKEEEGERAAEK